ncbi:MAG: alpha/beta fold hydrolase [Clostridia bacterium]|nr:alpha/beta fold hydrolase [Clostridia bacterium]
MEQEFFGFKRIDFTFQGRNAIIVFPNKANEKREWLLKSEYFGAFPKFEADMLARGYHLCYLENLSRWGTDEDQKAKRDFSEFLQKEYRLARKCICVGMSCGGFHAVNFASRYPSYVSALYLDAPLLSFYGWHDSFSELERQVWREEQKKAYGFRTDAELLVYNDQPINRLRTLTENKIPVALVYGGIDLVVDCKKNAEMLIQYYAIQRAPIKAWCKPECDHHPHGFEDNSELISYIENVKL